MVTTPDNNARADGGMYGFNAMAALQLYETFVDGDVDDTLMVVSTSALAEKARSALEASAKQLGFGAGAIAWITTHSQEGSLGAADLWQIVEGVDPLAIVTADAAATSLLSQSYGVSLKIDDANRIMCRTVAAFADFESMLADEDSKQKAWRLLKKLA